MLKRIISIVVVFATVFTFAANSLAYSRSVTFTTNDAYEIHAQNMPAGSWTGRIGVNSMTSNNSSPKLYEVLYGPGFVVVATEFTSTGSTTQNYYLAGLTYMHFSAEKRSSQNITATVVWDYNY